MYHFISHIYPLGNVCCRGESDSQLSFMNCLGDEDGLAAVERKVGEHHGDHRRGLSISVLYVKGSIWTGRFGFIIKRSEQ